MQPNLPGTWRRCISEWPLRFYACGGDGTLNEVAQGIRGMTGVSLTQMPLGTGNDLVKVFGGAQGFFELGSDAARQCLPRLIT